MPTATKPIRLSVRRLAGAGKVFDRLGISPRAALEMFLAQVESRKALPFAVALPDSEYAASEYELTAAEVVAAGKRMRRASVVARKAGTVRRITCSEDLLK